MAIKPELLQQDVTAADTDIVMKTDTAGVTKTITAGNFFTWLWNKIKGSTKSALDTADPTAPVNTNAVNGALTNYVKNSELYPLFILTVNPNQISNATLFYTLQSIIIQGTGVEAHTVEIMAYVDGVFCNRLHVAGGIQEFWTPETQVIKQYSYNDGSACTQKINIVACRI